MQRFFIHAKLNARYFSIALVKAPKSIKGLIITCKFGAKNFQLIESPQNSWKLL